MPSEDFLREWYQRYDVLGRREPYYAALAGPEAWGTPEGAEIIRQFALVKKHFVKCQMSNVKCLDVGSGPGLFLDLVKRAGWQGIGIELNAGAVAAGRRRFGIDVREGTIESVELPRGSFDAITLWDIFEHVRDPLGMLRRAHELLKSGGYLFLETPNARSFLDWAVMGFAKIGIPGPASTFYGLHHLTLWHPEVVRRALGQQGFAVKEICGGSTAPGRVFRGTGFSDRVMRMGVGCLEWIGKLIGHENKMLIIAQKRFKT